MKQFSVINLHICLCIIFFSPWRKLRLLSENSENTAIIFVVIKWWLLLLMMMIVCCSTWLCRKKPVLCVPLPNALFIYSSERREEKKKNWTEKVYSHHQLKNIFFSFGSKYKFFPIHLLACFVHIYIFPFVRSHTVFILSHQALCISHHQIFLFIAFPLRYFSIYFLLTVQRICVLSFEKISASFSSVRLIRSLAERQWLVVYFIGKIIPILK